MTSDSKVVGRVSIAVNGYIIGMNSAMDGNSILMSNVVRGRRNAGFIESTNGVVTRATLRMRLSRTCDAIAAGCLKLRGGHCTLRVLKFGVPLCLKGVGNRCSDRCSLGSLGLFGHRIPLVVRGQEFVFGRDRGRGVDCRGTYRVLGRELRGRCPGTRGAQRFFRCNSGTMLGTVVGRRESVAGSRDLVFDIKG